RLRVKIAQVFDFLVAKGLRDRALGNPAAAKTINKLFYVEPVTKHYRATERTLLPDVIRALVAPDPTALNAWVLPAPTRLRPGSARGATWREAARAARVWTIPPERMKTRKKGGEAFRVSLSDLAVEILERQARRRQSDWVFPGRSGSHLYYATFSNAAAR